jgi:coproporphyrinogen III oxidase-like Fe-S oxidoreductase
VDYLEAVEAELDLLREALAPRNILSQLHWGGGTPTYLSPAQCRQLFDAITSRFELSPDAEVAFVDGTSGSRSGRSAGGATRAAARAHP